MAYIAAHGNGIVVPDEFPCKVQIQGGGAKVSPKSSNCLEGWVDFPASKAWYTTYYIYGLGLDISTQSCVVDKYQVWLGKRMVLQEDNLGWTDDVAAGNTVLFTATPDNGGKLGVDIRLYIKFDSQTSWIKFESVALKLY